jgi:hypothetical protein
MRPGASEQTPAQGARLTALVSRSSSQSLHETCSSRLRNAAHRRRSSSDARPGHRPWPKPATTGIDRSGTRRGWACGPRLQRPPPGGSARSDSKCVPVRPFVCARGRRSGTSGRNPGRPRSDRHRVSGRLHARAGLLHGSTLRDRAELPRQEREPVARLGARRALPLGGAPYASQVRCQAAPLRQLPCDPAGTASGVEALQVQGGSWRDSLYAAHCLGTRLATEV